MANTDQPLQIAGLGELADSYRYLLCDVWGVVHDGQKAIPAADAALARFRAGGGIVVLITNAPRMKGQVLGQFEQFGVERAAFDDVVTSGEAAHAYLKGRPGIRVHHVGPKRDLPIYEGLDLTLTGEAEADLISCTGLFDDNVETPDDYAPAYARWRERGLPMLCVNPDKVVERGDQIVWCAGALADGYEAAGGKTTIVGKPHAPIYATALDRFRALAGGEVDRSAILAIGDGAATDVAGANGQGLDVLFITGGIHVDAFGERHAPDPAAVSRFLRHAGLGARATIPRLVW